MNQDKSIATFAVTLVMNACPVELRVLGLYVGREGSCSARKNERHDEENGAGVFEFHYINPLILWKSDLTMTSVISSVSGRGAAKSWTAPSTENSTDSAEPP